MLFQGVWHCFQDQSGDITQAVEGDDEALTTRKGLQVGQGFCFALKDVGRIATAGFFDGYQGRTCLDGGMWRCDVARGIHRTMSSLGVSGCFVNDAPCSSAEIGFAAALVFQYLDVEGTFEDGRCC